jgi:hypothetical protein
MGNNNTTPSLGTPRNSGALVNLFQVAANRGKLLSLVVTNTGPAQFLQIWDATAKSDASATQILPVYLPAATTINLDIPLAAARGILLRNSSVAVSTQAALAADTALGLADCWFLARTI